ncbi:MAG: glycosyltransferase [Defluviitaleaceae bacterium]|nr:glycosyltransferase [Defluviitaleaceae bacterium]
MKLIIQIPCYNEEKTLPQTFADLPQQIGGIQSIEYLIINDGSSDKTVEVAREIGINHIVNFSGNKGLAKAFMAGIDACLHLGADIIVNTDADNQYNGEDIEKLVRPIINSAADIVIGERPIEDTEHFSWKKKKLQRLGSWVVRVASGTDVPDAPSGFRAYSREAALTLNVVNPYTYTLETIIQAGNNKSTIASVPIRTNPETRESRLFKSMWGYIKKSAIVIVRSWMMYKPMRFFFLVGIILFVVGLVFDIRYLILFIMGTTRSHTPSLILAAALKIIGIQTVVVGLLADVVAANRKILEDVQLRVKRLEHSTVLEKPESTEENV